MVTAKTPLGVYVVIKHRIMVKVSIKVVRSRHLTTNSDQSRSIVVITAISQTILIHMISHSIIIHMLYYYYVLQLL